MFGTRNAVFWNAGVAPFCGGHLESDIAVGWLGRPNHGDGHGYGQCGHGERCSRVS